jgi:IS1 family transposase
MLARRGMSISAIARITRRARNTIARWLERAAASAKRFNDQHLWRFEIKELQADELCTFVGGKSNATWLFTIIEVTSRLWPSGVVGRRSYRNTEAIFNDVLHRGQLNGTVLVATDGFEYYERVVRRLMGVACVYGQVTKTRRNNRVIRVERNLRIGTRSRLATALVESEDSETLNTSFVERHNLTLRQGLAYLQRRSPAHARCERRLDEDLALVQCHYNFVRRHRGLKFGSVCKTPAMQAGLMQHPLSFRDIFAATDSSHAIATVLRFRKQAVMPESTRVKVQLAA